MVDFVATKGYADCGLRFIPVDACGQGVCVASDSPQRRVLVTGSGGQLGSELCRLPGVEVFGADLPSVDITDASSVRDVIERVRPDVVVNAAAYTQVDRAEHEEGLCRAVNVDGSRNLVRACRGMEISIVQISTDYVFDGRLGSSYCELDRPNPVNVYGRSKWEAEQIVAQHPGHLIVRTAGLFGSGGSTSGGNFVNTILHLAEQRQRIRVVDDQFTSFTYAPDLAMAIRALVGLGCRGIYHVANAGYGNWYQLAREVFRVAGVRLEVEAIASADYASAAQRPLYSVLDTGKYARTAGCYRMPSWQQGVSAYLVGRMSRSSC